MSDGVKHLLVKIILTISLIGIAFVVGRMLWTDHRASDEGTIHVELIDDEGTIVFSGALAYQKDDSFFDILQRHFDVTCANQSYGADPTCGYTFSSFAFQGKVILGIEGETFRLMSDWSTTFLAFYVKQEDTFVLSTSGPSQIPFDNGDEFRIVLESVWE